jgi:trk system potassium uptake protein
MKVVVVGGEGLPQQVASTLAELGEDVAFVDVASADPTVPATLEAAGVRRADVLVACSRSDEENLVVSYLAKHRFEVPRVIARVNDPLNRRLFDERWGVDAAVCPPDLLVEMIRRAGPQG